MNLQQLQDKGGFVKKDLIKTAVEWAHEDPVSGEMVTDTFDIFVKPASFGDVKRAISDNDKEMQCHLLAACVRLGEEGEEELTYEQAYQLETSLGLALIEAVNKAIGFGADQKKTKTASQTKSGTS